MVQKKILLASVGAFRMAMTIDNKYKNRKIAAVNA